jgi:hypothetical protein
MTRLNTCETTRQSLAAKPPRLGCKTNQNKVSKRMPKTRLSPHPMAPAPAPPSSPRVLAARRNTEGRQTPNKQHAREPLTQEKNHTVSQKPSHTEATPGAWPKAAFRSPPSASPAPAGPSLPCRESCATIAERTRGASSARSTSSCASFDGGMASSAISVTAGRTGREPSGMGLRDRDRMEEALMADGGSSRGLRRERTRACP